MQQHEGVQKCRRGDKHCDQWMSDRIGENFQISWKYNDRRWQMQNRSKGENCRRRSAREENY